MKNISILGATGSIGSQTLDVLRKEKMNFKLIAISANNNYHKVINIIEEFSPQYVAMMDENAFNIIKEYCSDKKLKVEVLRGIQGLNYIATLPEVDMVVTSVVGMIGLEPTINAIRAKKDIALANKETLVVAGDIVTAEAKANNVKILPVDSEHGAIFQCLQGNDKADLSKLILTASGGPFRGMKKEELIHIKPEQALKHPKWNMGKKISIDSATLMNKGLEVIEAHWLFNMDYNNIQVVVHPQSIIHSMVEYVDGSIIAQLAVTDMKLPIQYALNYPKRSKNIIEKLDFYNIGAITFEKPDMNTFMPLKLAYEAGKSGGLMPTILNGANEKAVELFLNGHIKFIEIGEIIEECLNKFENFTSYHIKEIIELDKKVKNYVEGKYL